MLEKILKPTALPLPGTTNIWHCGMLGSFDLQSRKHEIRIITKEWGVSQAVFSDQFEQKFADRYQTDEAIRRMVDNTIVRLEEDHLFFEIAETAFTLPAYFAAKVSYIAPENVTTQLGDQKLGQARKHAMKAPLDMRIQVRRVSTLNFQRRDSYDHNYTPPRFQVEVDGYWRRLSPMAVGRNKYGEPTVGRTWVVGHARWKDKPRKLTTVHVKSLIEKAFSTANAMLDKRGGEVAFGVG
jgi:hypothetical protein